VNIDQLIAALEKLRAKHSGAVPVVLEVADLMLDVSRLTVVDLYIPPGASAVVIVASLEECDRL
jgi:hypothetical protein